MLFQSSMRIQAIPKTRFFHRGSLALLLVSILDEDSGDSEGVRSGFSIFVVIGFNPR